MEKAIKLNQRKVQFYEMCFKELPDNMCDYKARWILIIITMLLFPSIFLVFIARMNDKINKIWLRVSEEETKKQKNDGQLLLGSAILINILGCYMSLIAIFYIRIRYVLSGGYAFGFIIGISFILIIYISILGMIRANKYYREKTKKYCSNIKFEDGFYVKTKEPIEKEEQEWNLGFKEEK